MYIQQQNYRPAEMFSNQLMEIEELKGNGSFDL